MRDILVFCYNLFFIIAYTSVIAIGVCLNMIRRRNIAIPVIGLYAFYLFDAVIIFMTEFTPAFTTGYNQTFINSPSIKTVVYLGIAFFVMMAWSVLVNAKFSPLQGAILIAYGLWLIFIPMMNSGAVESWLYYSGYQFFSIAVCSYALWKLKRLGQHEHEGPLGWIRALLILTILFSFLIMLEDSYVIFRVDNYNSALGVLSIFSRSVSEDILRLIYTAFFFRLFYKQFRISWMTAPGEDALPLEQEQDPLPPAPKPLAGVNTSASEEYRVIKFAQQLGLTEREMEVFRYLVAGQSNQQISETLHISMGTVKAHVHNIFLKAEVTHRYELLRLYDAFSAEPISK